MAMCSDNAILPWHGNLLQAQAAAVPEQAAAPAVVLHIGELPAQVQLSTSDVAALSLQALTDIWRVGWPQTSSPVCFVLPSCARRAGALLLPSELHDRHFVAVKSEDE